MSTFTILAVITSIDIFQKQGQLTYGQFDNYHIKPSNNSHKSFNNEISNFLLDKFKYIVFNYAILANNSSSIDNNATYDSYITIPIVVGFISPDGIQISGSGQMSKSNSTKVNENTIFDIASISKTFVATIYADMVNQGLIDSSDPIEQYLPQDKVKVPSYNGHKITLENLATHTSGMPDFPIGWVRNHSYSTQQVYDFISDMTLATEPGKKASYSDIGMGLLGHILSIKSGLSFDQIVKDRILNVLGMNSTGMRINATQVSVPESIQSRYAIGHIAGEEVNLEFVPEAIQSAGAMYSSANDLLKYLSANIGLLKTEISDSIEDTHVIRYPFGHSSEKDVLQDYIGLGWTVTTDFVKEVIWHTGSIDGYTSIIGFNPSRQIGLVIVCGCNYNDFSAQEMINMVIPFLLHYETSNHSPLQ